MEFYAFDFLKKIFKFHNFSIVIYLLLNITIITLIIGLIYSNNLWQAFLYGLVLYMISVIIALSSIGECLLRIECNCIPLNNKKKKSKKRRHIKEYAMYQRVQPLFDEVIDRAKENKAYVPENIKIFYTEENSLNAFALGRKTICITEGLLVLSDEEIKSVLAHEVGHISNHDTDLILLVIIGNLIVSIFFFVIRLVTYLITKIMLFVSYVLSFGFRRVGVLLNNFSVSLYRFVSKILSLLIWLWAKLGMLLTMNTKREQEYKADTFSKEMGYKDGLIKFLSTILEKEKDFKRKRSVFSILTSSHPKTQKRITKIINN